MIAHCWHKEQAKHFSFTLYYDALLRRPGRSQYSSANQSMASPDRASDDSVAAFRRQPLHTRRFFQVGLWTAPPMSEAELRDWDRVGLDPLAAVGSDFRSTVMVAGRP